MTKKVFLCLMLIFFSFGQTFGQERNLSIEVSQNFKAEIARVLLFSTSADGIDSQVDAICTSYGNRGLYFFYGTSADKNYWKGKANKIFEKSKKELESLDKKMAKGKSISADDANEAATLYSLGYAPICSLDYKKAADFYGMLGDDAALPVKFARECCLYKVNGDKSQAIGIIDTLDFNDLWAEKEKLTSVAVKYGLTDDLNTIIKKKTAEFATANERTIKRALRSKNWDLLKSYSDYAIFTVDSALCVNFDWQDGGIWWEKCRQHGYALGYAQNSTTIFEYLLTAEDVFPIFDYDRTMKEIMKDHDFSGERNFILTATAHDDPYAGLILCLSCAGCDNKYIDKAINVLVKRIPEVLTWKDFPLLIGADGTVKLKKPYADDDDRGRINAMLSLRNHWREIRNKK